MKIKKGSLNYWVLSILEKAIQEGLPEMLTYSGQMKYLWNLRNGINPVKKNTFLKSIQRMKKAGLLTQEATQDGERLLKLSDVSREFLENNYAWDGKYRIIIWDIPENKRRYRDLLRRKLKEWEFVRIQKSVWVSKKNVTDKLRNLVDELDMDKWVIVIESEDEILRKNFHDRGVNCRLGG